MLKGVIVGNVENYVFHPYFELDQAFTFPYFLMYLSTLMYFDTIQQLKESLLWDFGEIHS